MKKSLIISTVAAGIMALPALASAGAAMSNGVIASGAAGTHAITTTDLTTLRSDVTITLSENVSLAASEVTSTSTITVGTKHKQSSSKFVGNTDGGSLTRSSATAGSDITVANLSGT